jgi:hypothetical protein
MHAHVHIQLLKELPTNASPINFAFYIFLKQSSFESKTEQNKTAIVAGYFHQLLMKI